MAPLSSINLTPLSIFAIALVFIFATMLMRIIFNAPRLFTKRIGRRHAQTGAAYLFWLAAGYITVIYSYYVDAPAGMHHVLFDGVLGVLGITLTLTAAHEFGHKSVRNRASGTLDEDATVTYDEMLEHAFYQGLNVAQAMFIAYVSQPATSFFSRAVCASACTAPWLIRSAFPVHSFSKNYSDSNWCERCPRG
jgi:hypothetical protein